MSIIAATLQRLQKETKSEVSDSSSNDVLPRCKREPGWHNPPSGIKFWLAGLGMAIGLSGLGLVAYWIGFHLDFGMSTYASPNQGTSLLPSPSVPETPPFDSFESMETPDTPFFQDSSSLSFQQPDKTLSTVQDAASSKPPDPPATENPLPILKAVKISVSETDTQSISPVTGPTQPRKVITNKSIPENVADDSNEDASAKPKTAPSGLPDVSHPHRDHAGSKPDESEEFQVIEKPVPLKGDVKEAGVMEEFSRLSHQAIEDTSPLLNEIAMIPKKEEASQTAQALNGVQSSPVKLLRHVQQLIQDGAYEEAVSVLSPLFKDPPVNWEPWFWMGTALLGQNQLEEADQFFLSGLARNDKIPQLWLQRGLVAQQRGEYQLAIYELRRAESLDATLPHIHLNMGYAYEKLGNDHLANEYYARFLKFSEGNPAFFSIRKKLYARLTEQVHTAVSPGISSSLPGNPTYMDDRSQP